MKRWVLPAVVVVVLGVLMIEYMASGAPSGQWTYSDLISHAQAGQVKKISIGAGSGVATDTSGKTYSVSLPSDQSVTLGDALRADGVDVSYQATGDLASMLLGFLPNLLFLLVLVGLVYWSYRSMQRGQGQAMSFGRSKPRLVSPQRSVVTFRDVAGVEEAQGELAEIVEFLKGPDRFRALGARIPRGVLMVGPPGSGKTLLARAVAGEAAVPFFSISGSEFVEMFVGVGASRVRDLFDQAKKASPCIVFVDEIDAVGRQRGAGLGGGNDEREQTLNQLLVEMDGFDTDTHVIVIAATNRPDVLDPALLRPGRFDRHVVLDRPDVRGRRAILDVHVRDKPMASEVDLDIIARQTPGFCGADLANMVNEAAILAARAGRKDIGMHELEESIYRVLAGPERKSVRITDEEKRIVAFHEAGHAIVMHELPLCDRVHRISIMSRGAALGWTLSLPGEDQHLVGVDALHQQLAGLMGGRVAEDVVFGNVTSGAENDIKKATQIVRRMVTQWGMSDRIGPVTMGENNELVFLGRDLGERRNYSEEMAALIDEEVRTTIENAGSVARKILTEHRSVLGKLAERLMSEETVEGKELDAMLQPEQPKIAMA